VVLDFFHVLDLSDVDAWLLWRRANPTLYMPLSTLKAEVAECLCKAGQQTERERRRPRDIDQQHEENKKLEPAAPFSTSDIRLDQIDHFPEWLKVDSQ